MKLILVGATGFVGAECLRLALQNPDVTEIVALARREVKLPENSSEHDKTKLSTVLLEDFGHEYPNSVKERLRGADACIWNLALTPHKIDKTPAEEVKKICHDYTLIGLKAMSEVSNKPLRFIYTSGALTERDQNRSLWVMAEHRKMRGETEVAVLDFASKSNGKVQAQITKPGLISSGANAQLVKKTILWYTIGLPSVRVDELAASEVDQAVNGLEKDVLENYDCVRVGKEALCRYGLK